MARGRTGSRPTHYIAVSAKVGKGRYEKGPYIGLWEGEDRDGPLFRGSVSGKYLDELADFIKDYGEDSVGFAIFKSRGDKGDRDRDGEDRGSSRGRDRGERDRDDREERGSKRDRDDDDRGSKRGKKRDDRDDDRGSKRGSKGKKDDWFDD